MKKIIYIIGLPILFVVSQFFINIIATIIFIVSKNASVEWIGTESYVEELNQFLNQYGIFILLLLFVFWFPLFYKKHHNEVNENKSNLFIIYLLLLGSSFSLFYNSLLSIINQIYSITDLFVMKTNWLLGLLGTVLCGPILEEYLFRGIVYERLKKQTTVKKAILFTGILFSFLHINLFQIIYAFFVNFLFIISYERFSTIKAPILVHISGNLTSLLFTLYFNHPEIKECLLILSIILFSYSYKIVKNCKIGYNGN